MIQAVTDLQRRLTEAASQHREMKKKGGTHPLAKHPALPGKPPACGVVFKGASSMSLITEIKTTIPPIDRATPATLETATFALG
jgi:hypothetical protein